MVSQAMNPFVTSTPSSSPTYLFFFEKQASKQHHGKMMVFVDPSY